MEISFLYIMNHVNLYIMSVSVEMLVFTFLRHLVRVKMYETDNIRNVTGINGIGFGILSCRRVWNIYQL